MEYAWDAKALAHVVEFTLMCNTKVRGTKGTWNSYTGGAGGNERIFVESAWGMESMQNEDASGMHRESRFSEVQGMSVILNCKWHRRQVNTGGVM